MIRTRWLYPLVCVLLVVIPSMESHAQKAMGKTVPTPTEPEGEKETPPATESKPLALWEKLSGDGESTTIQAVRFGASKPSSMRIVKRGNLALTEGDMVVGLYEQVVGAVSKENAIRNPQMKWPMVNGKIVVPYEVQPGVSRQTVQALEAAIQEYNQKTCVQFVRRSAKDRNYVSVFEGDGCYSYVGCIQQGKQELSLGRGCEFKGTTVHELMHALGFYHEQSRPDRDNYLEVHFENVESGLEDQFDVCRDCTTQDIPYEYASIMHYGAQAFTKNGKATLVPKQRGAQVVEPYDKPGLTALDVKKIHKLYGCK